MSQMSVGAVPLAMILMVCRVAEARPLHVSQSYPVAETIVDGINAQYIVRFDGWVDHAASRIEIFTEGKLLKSLVPTGDSEPDVLAAAAPLLASGSYTLHWYVKSVPDGDFSDGTIRFTVAR